MHRQPAAQHDVDAMVLALRREQHVALLDVDAAALRKEIANALGFDAAEQRDALEKRPAEIRVDPVCKRLQARNAHTQARWLTGFRS